MSDPQLSYTYRVEPSPLLGRLQSFLPQLKAANEQLGLDISRDGVSKYNFEDTTGASSTIQMNLSLGVLQKPNSNDSNNIAILPSQLAQIDAEKREQQGDIVLPWNLADSTTQQQNMNMIEITQSRENNDNDNDGNNDGINDSDNNDDDNNDDDGSIIDQAEMIDRTCVKKQRPSHNCANSAQDNAINAKGNNDSEELITLGHDGEQEKDFQLSQQLFGHQQTISAAEAVQKLRELGYEPVHDVSKGTDHLTASEISMCDNDTPVKQLIEEIE